VVLQLCWKAGVEGVERLLSRGVMKGQQYSKVETRVVD
jgi:hypothetical protein